MQGKKLKYLSVNHLNHSLIFGGKAGVYLSGALYGTLQGSTL